jgi:hypothetical protein
MGESPTFPDFEYKLEFTRKMHLFRGKNGKMERSFSFTTRPRNAAHCNSIKQRRHMMKL